ncbi:hypothetical protein DMA11_22670 [Marinilabiliaceae bacterium JC017]|nr:hypothetical protein DMA11_22670 [Marinilabiliaceae bacterium JC017]
MKTFWLYLQAMKIYSILILFVVSYWGGVMAQERPSMPEKENKKVETIVPDVKRWRMIDDFSLADTISVDTLTTGYQVYNPIYRQSFSNVHLGNNGAPYQSNILSERVWRNEIIFHNSLPWYFAQPSDLTFYNTLTPYTNVFYHFGGPKRRSEEAVGVMFTQNVNKNWNVGLSYNLYSSVGQYDAQKSDNQSFKFFSSYDGEKYSIQGAFLYAKVEQFENGGLLNDSDVINGNPDFDQPENIPVRFRTAKNEINDIQFFINQSLDVGSIKIKDGEDGDEDVRLPIGTMFHTLNFQHGKRVYGIDDLSDYYKTDGNIKPFYEDIYIDSLRTRDSVRYNALVNTFQIKFNEEANPLLKFGLRAYISNEVRNYTFPFANPDGKPVYIEDEKGNKLYQYQSQDTTLVTTCLGGQIFKNEGENFWWNAGMRFYFQGYRLGDTELTGRINSQFRLFRDTAGIFADGGLYLRSPELFQNKYSSNHYKWENDFNAVKTVRLKGGVRIPTKRFTASVETRFINDYIFWNAKAEPQQSSDFVKTIEAKVNQHFILGRIHCLNEFAWQYTSNAKVIPLPDIALYSSNYYENKLFKVLTFQIGFDLRYHSAYFTPAYMPATGQFYIQEKREVGDYPFVDVFLNCQLKRARFYVKYDHVNEGFPNNDYFYTIGYPANPRSLKFGVSWNFYD